MQLKVLVFGVLLLASIMTNAQLKVFPVQKETKQSVNSRTESNTLTLPFWDDFSFTQHNRPLDSLWQNSANVYVGDGLAKNPPSIGAASLDGVDANGQGYTGSTTGPTDALTSCPIDLSGLTVSDNVFISFYYQYAGNGEQPEDADSLRLEVFNVTADTSFWDTIWPANSQELDRSGDFVQALVRLDTVTLFSDQFQFRFQAFGRPVGFFDVWNIDYVYVNENRSLSDNNYPDRTISSPLSNIFDGLYAVPARQFNDSQIIDPSFIVSSVDNPNDNPQPYTFLYDMEIVNYENGVSDTTNFNSGSLGNGLSIQAPNSREITIDNFTASLVLGAPDSSFISIETYIDANDNLLGGEGDYDIRFEPIDFRWNDTTRSEFIIKDFYAYDDGTAELAAGLSFSGNRLAIEFPFNTGITDTIVAVDMYFPLASTEPNGRLIDLTVWDESAGIPGEVLRRETVVLIRNPEPNKFTRYELTNPVILSDTFFLGYRQAVEGDLGVGYDLSNNTNSKVFFNIADTWQQTSSPEFQGSFMIRPVFGNPSEDTVITSINRPLYGVSLFPNPNQGTFTLRGDFLRAQVYNIHGVLIHEAAKTEEELIVDITQQPEGIYIVRIFEGLNSRTIKLIKK